MRITITEDGGAPSTAQQRQELAQTLLRLLKEQTGLYAAHLVVPSDSPEDPPGTMIAIGDLNVYRNHTVSVYVDPPEDELVVAARALRKATNELFAAADDQRTAASRLDKAQDEEIAAQEALRALLVRR